MIVWSLRSIWAYRLIIKIINITAAQAVDREFVDIVCPLGLFWLPVDWLWAAFGLNLGPTWLPLGCSWAPWGPHGVPWGSLGCPLGCHGGPAGIPWGSLGLPWGALGCLGRFSRIFRKLDAQFRANVSICTRLRIEYSLPELSRGSPGSRGSRGSGIWTAARYPPFSRRGPG